MEFTERPTGFPSSRWDCQHPTVKKQAEASRHGPGALGIDLEALANLPSLACLAAWDHGKLNASFEQDGEVQALYREAAGFDQSQGKTVR